MWSVYLVECRDGSIYTGMTNDVSARVKRHNQGRGARYTAARRPVRLLAVENFRSRSKAASREWRIKRLSRQEKLRLAASR